MREPTVGLDEPSYIPPPPPRGKADRMKGPPSEPPRGPTSGGKFPFALFFLSVLLFGGGGALAGFYYGDAFGREHAQFNNPSLRDHYVGQCMTYVESEYKKAVRESLDKLNGRAAGANKEGKLEQDIAEIRSNLASLKEAYMDKKANPSVKTAGVSDNDKSVRRLLNLLETRHVELVSDRCPASPSLPRKYSKRG